MSGGAHTEDRAPALRGGVHTEDRAPALRGGVHTEDRAPALRGGVHTEDRAPALRGGAPRVYCALIHYPVQDRAGQTVTTAVTNLDVHDIARSARTFGLRRYYVVTPIAAQHVLVQRIIEHWTEGAGRKRIPERHVALALCESLPSLDHALADVTAREGARPRIVATAARRSERGVTRFAELREQIAGGTESYLILFGTGHGLATTVLDGADVLLEPIGGGRDYNHLSVRAAAAITLDRLLG